jgi:hypothetical protein
MTHSHFDTWHHNKISKARRVNNMTRDSKSVNLTHFRRLSICNLFSRNTSHSHDNLRRVSKSPLLHPFTRCRSGTLDWRVTNATSADSSRLIHTILAHSSTLLLHSSTPLYLSIFCNHRTSSNFSCCISKQQVLLQKPSKQMENAAAEVHYHCPWFKNWMPSHHMRVAGAARAYSTLNRRRSTCLIMRSFVTAKWPKLVRASVNQTGKCRRRQRKIPRHHDNHDKSSLTAFLFFTWLAMGVAFLVLESLHNAHDCSASHVSQHSSW